MLNHIVVLFNPNSSGQSESIAKTFADKLAEKNRKLTITLKATEHAGHAIDLARELSAPNTMIISSSGDGGLNEVVNGVMTSKHPDTTIGVLPAGNANDHYHARHRGDVIDRIITNDYDTVDVLTIQFNDTTLYCHSYAGLGITATIGHELTKADLNPISEAWIVAKGLFKRTPVKIKRGRRTEYYDSIVFGIVDQMSKYLSPANENTLPSGHFTITENRASSLLGLIRHITHLSNSSTHGKPQTSYTCTLQKSAKIQCDGETTTIPANTELIVTCQKNALREIV